MMSLVWVIQRWIYMKGSFPSCRYSSWSSSAEGAFGGTGGRFWGLFVFNVPSQTLCYKASCINGFALYFGEEEKEFLVARNAWRLMVSPLNTHLSPKCVMGLWFVLMSQKNTIDTEHGHGVHVISVPMHQTDTPHPIRVYSRLHNLWFWNGWSSHTEPFDLLKISIAYFLFAFTYNVRVLAVSGNTCICFLYTH